jgi:hypothetical protein
MPRTGEASAIGWMLDVRFWPIADENCHSNPMQNDVHSNPRQRPCLQAG